MSTVSLPNNSTLDKMRREAKLLQRGVRVRHPEALALVARHHPDGLSADFPLHAAQLVVARAHGFASWPRLKHYFDAAADLRFDGSDHHTGDGSAADEFCRLASLDYAADGPQRWAAARELLAGDPGLPVANIWAAASAVDGASVREHLGTDPGLAPDAAALSGGPRSTTSATRGCPWTWRRTRCWASPNCCSTTAPTRMRATSGAANPPRLPC